jgi:hypothetical protein
VRLPNRIPYRAAIKSRILQRRGAVGQSPSKKNRSFSASTLVTSDNDRTGRNELFNSMGASVVSIVLVELNWARDSGGQQRPAHGLGWNCMALHSSTRHRFWHCPIPVCWGEGRLAAGPKPSLNDHRLGTIPSASLPGPSELGPWPWALGPLPGGEAIVSIAIVQQKLQQVLWHAWTQLALCILFFCLCPVFVEAGHGANFHISRLPH